MAFNALYERSVNHISPLRANPTYLALFTSQYILIKVITVTHVQKHKNTPDESDACISLCANKTSIFKFYFSVREEVKDAAGKWRVPFRAPIKFGHQNVPDLKSLVHWYQPQILYLGSTFFL